MSSKSAVNKWKTYAESIANINPDIDASRRVGAFIYTMEQFSSLQDQIGTHFVFWADTENQLTTVLPPESTGSTHPILSTAFNVLRQSDSNNLAAHEANYAACEELAWKIIRKIQKDARSPECFKIQHIYNDFIEIDREGPYLNGFYGVLVRLRLKINDAIPAYSDDDWTIES